MLIKVLDNIYCNPFCHLAAEFLEKNYFWCGLSSNDVKRRHRHTLSKHSHLLDLLEIMLKGGTVTLYPYHGHLPGFWNTHNNVCTVSKRSSLMGHRLESTRICRISQKSHCSNFNFMLHFYYALQELLRSPTLKVKGKK